MTLSTPISAGLSFDFGTKTKISLGPKIILQDAIPVGRYVPENANISVLKQDVTLDSDYGAIIVIDDVNAPDLKLHSDIYCGQFNVPKVGQNISGKIVVKFKDYKDDKNFHINNT